MSTDQILSVTDLRTKTSQILKSLNNVKYIFSNNKPKAVLLSMEKYENFMNKLKEYQIKAEVNDTEKFGKDFNSVDSLMEDLFS